MTDIIIKTVEAWEEDTKGRTIDYMIKKALVKRLRELEGKTMPNKNQIRFLINFLGLEETNGN